MAYIPPSLDAVNFALRIISPSLPRLPPGIDYLLAAFTPSELDAVDFSISDFSPSLPEGILSELDEEPGGNNIYDRLFGITITDGIANIITESTEAVVTVDEQLIGGLLVKGHYWNKVATNGSPATIKITPILSGGSSRSSPGAWDVYLPEENEQIGYVGQSLKQVTHLVATFLIYHGASFAIFDMSFDHIFVDEWYIID